MYLIKTLSTVINIGTRRVTDSQEKLLINKVNGIAFSLTILSLIFGLLIYILSGVPIVLIATTIESLLFLIVIILNHYERHALAANGLLTVLHAAILYFGLLLGNAIDGLWLALFLIVTSLLFLNTRTALRISLAGGSISLLLIEANKFFPFVKPFPFTPGVQLAVHYSAIGMILFMTVLTLLHYIQHNTSLMDRIREDSGELEKANRSLKVFMRELTHEIRTPLNAIYSISQLKLIEGRSDKERITNQHLHFACHNVLSIINNVQDRSKMEAGQPDEIKRELFALRAWIQEVCNIYRYFADSKHVRILLETDDMLPAALFEDKTILTKIANNIIGNAIKFTRKNSVVTVAILQKGNSWQMAVSDQGAGISREKLDTLFDEFTRERVNFAEGTGLGLNIARKLTFLLQGSIAVNSIPGLGTTFVVTLPIQAYVGTVLERPRTENAADMPFSGKKVLLIEDDLMSRQYLSRFLSKNGFTVSLAEDGKEGLYLAGIEVFDIIISDMGLPGMDGRELLLQLKKEASLQQIPVVITSADTAVKDEVLRAGATGYLAKPVDFKLLHKLLKEIMLHTAMTPETAN